MDVPLRFLDTERVTPDTHVIRQVAGEGLGPVVHYLNSAVVTGAEPVIVDCGLAPTRDGWLDRVFGLVDPADVRWIFLSHDDTDHTGNLAQVMDLCPQATLVTSMFAVQRIGADTGSMIDPSRIRLVNDGESWWAGDRELVAVRPPTYDSPTTRGLYDTASGVYWASDSFACATPAAEDDVTALDPGVFADGFVSVQQMLSPWVEWLDRHRYGAHLARIAGLGARAVTSAHGLTLRGGQIDTALGLLAELPDRPVQPDMSHAEFEQMLASLAPVGVA